MKVVLTKEWKVAPQGHTVITYFPGTMLIGRVAGLAMADGVGRVIEEEQIETSSEPGLETKVEPQMEKKRRGRPPKNRDQEA